MSNHSLTHFPSKEATYKHRRDALSAHRAPSLAISPSNAAHEAPQAPPARFVRLELLAARLLAALVGWSAARGMLNLLMSSSRWAASSEHKAAEVTDHRALHQFPEDRARPCRSAAAAHLVLVEKELVVAEEIGDEMGHMHAGMSVGRQETAAAASARGAERVRPRAADLLRRADREVF